MGKILVIDDEDDVRAMLRQALAAAGHDVFEARNGEEGVNVYQTHAIDLVVTDILMPGREGLECILELRGLNPAVRVIAISAGGHLYAMDVLEVARRFGARRAFWKPFDLAKVLAAIQEELQERAATKAVS